MTIALITDNHFGCRNDSKIFHDIFREYYLNEFFPAVVAAGVKVIVVLGDFFDRRKFINFETLALAKSIFFSESKRLGLEVHIICGNHDVVFKNTNSVNSLQLLTEEFENVRVYVEPTEVEIDGSLYLMLPWLNVENYDLSLKMLQSTNARFVISHLELSGFEYQTGIVSEHNQIDTALLGRFEYVFSGHYHKKSSRGNIHYLGTPYQITWSDYGDERGFHFFDSTDLTFVPNSKKNFFRFVYDDASFTIKQMDALLADTSTFDGIESKYVKVLISSKKYPLYFERFLEKLEERSPQDLKVIDESNYRQEDELDDDSVQTMTTPEIIAEFVDNIVQTDLDKQIIKDKLNRLYIEALKESDGEE